MKDPAYAPDVDEDAGRAQWDVFVSYSRSDAQQAGVLASALRGQGLQVFVDETAVDDFASITATITTALAHSRALLAVYSAEYPRRRACQWELTYAYLAGQREGDPRRRVLVVNPAAGSDHVEPVELRDARHWPWPGAPAELDRFASRVTGHVSRLRTPMGESWSSAGGLTPPLSSWLLAPARTGSARFTGRLTEQWQIHTALHRHHAPLVAPSGAGSGRTAQLRGMPGIGKSLLAQEYALRFGSAFLGGVFWFDLHSVQETGDPSAVMDAYTRQVATAADALGLDASELHLPSLLSRLAIFLGERGVPCLWVVDGLPDGLADEQLHQLRGPHLLASTLVTTRSLRYTAFAEAVGVTPLPAELPDGSTEVWVGAPLRVHRRCDDPMFTISNTIAYDGLMVNSTPDRGAYSYRPASSWVDLVSTQAEGHWIPEEGRALRQILERLAATDGIDLAKHVYVISPFRAVVAGARQVCRGLLPMDRVGTVHTTQGKEADVVILILGTDPARPGARAWAASRPNLLNVAVSRAKRRLFVIGNRDAWRDQRHFTTLAAELPHHAWPPAGT